LALQLGILIVEALLADTLDFLISLSVMCSMHSDVVAAALMAANRSADPTMVTSTEYMECPCAQRASSNGREGYPILAAWLSIIKSDDWPSSKSLVASRFVDVWLLAEALERPSRSSRIGSGRHHAVAASSAAPPKKNFG
jgi:hypothetical protein